MKRWVICFAFGIGACSGGGDTLDGGSHDGTVEVDAPPPSDAGAPDAVPLGCNTIATFVEGFDPETSVAIDTGIVLDQPDSCFRINGKLTVPTPGSEEASTGV